MEPNETNNEMDERDDEPCEGGAYEAVNGLATALSRAMGLGLDTCQMSAKQKTDGKVVTVTLKLVGPQESFREALGL